MASASLEVLETSVAVGVWGPGQVACPCDDPCSGGGGEEEGEEGEEEGEEGEEGREEQGEEEGGGRGGRRRVRRGGRMMKEGKMRNQDTGKREEFQLTWLEGLACPRVWEPVNSWSSTGKKRFAVGYTAPNISMYASALHFACCPYRLVVLSPAHKGTAE